MDSPFFNPHLTVELMGVARFAGKLD